MSGSAGLAAAKRRRAGPSAVTNEIPKRPSNLPSNQQQSQQQINQASVSPNLSNTHPLIILAQHEQQLSRLQLDIEDIRMKQERNVSTNHSQSVDEQSIQFFKSRYESMTE